MDGLNHAWYKRSLKSSISLSDSGLGVTWCFRFIAAAALQQHLLLLSKSFVLNLRYLGQRTYRSGEMYWMTFLWPWLKVTARWGTRSENRWGCAAGRWKLDPKRLREKWNLGPKRLNSLWIGSLSTPKVRFGVGGWEKVPQKIIFNPQNVKKADQNGGTSISLNIEGVPSPGVTAMALINKTLLVCAIKWEPLIQPLQNLIAISPWSCLLPD